MQSVALLVLRMTHMDQRLKYGRDFHAQMHDYTGEILGMAMRLDPLISNGES